MEESVRQREEAGEVKVSKSSSILCRGSSPSSVVVAAGVVNAVTNFNTKFGTVASALPSSQLSRVPDSQALAIEQSACLMSQAQQVVPIMFTKQ